MEKGTVMVEFMASRDVALPYSSNSISIGINGVKLHIFLKADQVGVLQLQ